jgi:anaerobic ribonucleoside-triphosphate reductase activating protein
MKTKISSVQLNIANINPSTRALGPGERGVVWVQGCPFNCHGCIAPEWIPNIPAYLMTPMQAVEKLLASPTITGLTLSGGEPMLQATGLAILAKIARFYKQLNIICFTGYKYDNLLKNPPSSGVFDLLGEVDVLIDGNYVQKLNSGKGLRGSDNQHIIHLTDRLKKFDLENSPRQMEMHIQAGEIAFIGIPPIPVDEVIGVVTPVGF